MIYRHYKGGLYFNVGFATRFSHDFPAKNIEKVAMARYTEAKTPEEEKEIAVLFVNDKLTGSTYYAYESTLIDGVHVLYKDLQGKYWLRPVAMFLENVDGVPRFKKVRGEELFNLISNGMGEEKII
jgi:hypothetical protein